MEELALPQMCLYIFYILGLKTKEEDEIWGTEGSLVKENLWYNFFTPRWNLMQKTKEREREREKPLTKLQLFSVFYL